MSRDIWLSHTQTPHFAVCRYDGRDDVGIMYGPQGTVIIREGDEIVRLEDGTFWKGDEADPAPLQAIEPPPAGPTPEELEAERLELEKSLEGDDVQAHVEATA